MLKRLVGITRRVQLNILSFKGGALMTTFRFISGISCVGKSHYIKTHSNSSDDVYVDIFEYQKIHSDIITAEYLFYAELEKLLRKNKNSDRIVWVETPFFAKYRRTAVVKLLSSLSEGMGYNVRFELYFLTSTNSRYLENLSIRYPDIKETDNIYEIRMTDVELPTQEEMACGWHHIEIVDNA